MTTVSQLALEQFLAGRDSFEKGRYTESRPHFEEARAEDPQFAMAYLFSSYLSLDMKDRVTLLEKAASLAGRASEGERLWISGVWAGFYGQTMKQKDAYEKLVNLYPADERVFILFGDYYMSRWEYKLAIEEYQLALKIDPGFLLVYLKLSCAHMALGDFVQAEKIYMTGLEQNPEDFRFYGGYAELLMKQGNFEESMEAYQKALDLYPAFKAAVIGMAFDLIYMGHGAKARENLQILFENGSDDGLRRQILLAIAISWVEEGRFREALEILKERYRISAKLNDPLAKVEDLDLMGRLYLEIGEFEKAMDAFSEAVKRVNISEFSVEKLADERRLFLFHSACVDIKRCHIFSAKTESSEFRRQVLETQNRFQRSLSFLLEGEIALQEKNFKKALKELKEVDIRNPETDYFLALAYQGVGEDDMAIKLLEKATNSYEINSLNCALVRQRIQAQRDQLESNTSRF